MILTAVGIIVTIISIVIALIQFGIFKRKKKIINKDTPLPDKDFRTFTIGNIDIPVSGIISSVKEPYSYNEVHIEFQEKRFEEKQDYPKEIANNKQYLIKKVIEKYSIENYRDNKLVRLDSVFQGHENEDDKRGDLNLKMSVTSYGDMLATNSALDICLPNNSKRNSLTLRDILKYTPFTDLQQSFFANPPGIEVIVLSKNIRQSPDLQVLVRKRSNNVVGYKGHYQVSASGYMSLSHKDENNIPHPFITACQETNQEIAEGLLFKPTDFKLLGIGLHWHGLYPNLIGYFITDKMVNEIIGDFRRDGYEGEIYSLAFTPNDIITHIANNHWTPMSAYSMILVLSSFYNKSEIERIAMTVKHKSSKDFLLNAEN